MCQNVFRAIQDFARQTGQPRDLNAVALVRAAGHDFAQENDLLVPFPHRDVEVDHSLPIHCQLGQLVIMGREERAGLDFVVQKFRHAPRNRQAIERRGPAPNLIKNDEAALGRIVYDVRSLVHLNHESRLPA